MSVIHSPKVIAINVGLSDKTWAPFLLLFFLGVVGYRSV